MMEYTLDTSYIWASYDECCRFGRCNSHWGMLTSLSHHSQCHLIGAVIREIVERKEFGEDMLAEIWGFNFRRFNAYAEFKEVHSFVKANYHNNRSRRKFLNLKKADAYIIAQAMKDGSNLVTMEKPDPKLKDTKIPDVCDALKVKWMHPDEFLKAVQPGAAPCGCLY